MNVPSTETMLDERIAKGANFAVPADPLTPKTPVQYSIAMSNRCTGKHQLSVETHRDREDVWANSK